MQRTLSSYYYMRYSERRGKHADKFRKEHGDVDIDQCLFETKKYADTCLTEYNLQSHYFCGMESSQCHEDSQMELLERQAIENLRLHYTVGINERYIDTLRMLEKRFPAFFDGAVSLYLKKQEKVLNSNEHPQPSANAMKYLQEHVNQIDYRLYKEGQKKFSILSQECI